MQVGIRKLAVVFDEVTIYRRVAEHARQLAERCKEGRVRELTVIVCLKGAAPYGVHLGAAMSRLEVAPSLRYEYVYKTRYQGGAGTEHVRTRLEIPIDAVLGKRVLIVDDIIDDGVTALSVYQDVLARKPIVPP
ncbi:MAG: phosphoribosyltransferase family protein [Patescibacteria group bacterium]|jgi:hypoxanthine-guanine phosphoribosyltransferase